MRVTLIILTLLLTNFVNGQTLITDTLYFDNGAKVAIKRNATTTTTPTTSRLADSTGARKVVRISVTGERKIYCAINDAEKEGFSHSKIVIVAQGKRKSHGGFKWEYI